MSFLNDLLMWKHWDRTPQTHLMDFFQVMHLRFTKYICYYYCCFLYLSIYLSCDFQLVEYQNPYLGLFLILCKIWWGIASGIMILYVIILFCVWKKGKRSGKKYSWRTCNFAHFMCGSDSSISKLQSKQKLLREIEVFDKVKKIQDKQLLATLNARFVKSRCRYSTVVFLNACY